MTAAVSVFEPDPERLGALLAQFSAADVGGTAAGGVSRPAASAADKAARDRFRSVAEKLGLTVRVDDIGNMYARRAGTDPAALPLVIGSHLDTVVPGGRFDGILGVCAALETVALLNAANLTTRRPIEVVNWTGEEGARFAPAMMGSGVVTGVYGIEEARAATDADGIRLGDELDRIGYAGQAANRLGEFFASLEMHIEQGAELEEAGVDVGIVALIRPVRWFTVTVTGPGGHAGGPGPAGRHEALVAAARMIVAARDHSVTSTHYTTTVGKIAVQPGSNNVMPHEVTFNLDMRSGTDADLDTHVAAIRQLFDAIAGEEQVAVEMTLNWGMPSADFDDDIRALLARAAERRGAGWLELDGHIGHDSLYLAQRGPAAMVFTPTRQGRSHCEDEFSPFDSILVATGVYADAALALANAR